MDFQCRTPLAGTGHRLHRIHARHLVADPGAFGSRDRRSRGRLILYWNVWCSRVHGALLEVRRYTPTTNRTSCTNRTRHAVPRRPADARSASWLRHRVARPIPGPRDVSLGRIGFAGCEDVEFSALVSDSQRAHSRFETAGGIDGERLLPRNRRREKQKSYAEICFPWPPGECRIAETTAREPPGD
jgi:hypothetical protein